MDKSINKVKCPICDLEFIPSFFQEEPLDYNSSDKPYQRFLKFFKHSNGTLKPLHVIRKAWITSCPECSYILRFAAELGDKELINGNGSVSHRGSFKELDGVFEYKFKTVTRPYKEILDYDKEYIDEKTQKIIENLDELDLFVWGKPYKKWTIEKSIDSFKFLIMFYSTFINYCKSLNKWTKIQDFSFKVDSLPISSKLKQLLVQINELQRRCLTEYYELTPDDAKTVKTVYLRLIFELTLDKLIPLELHEFLYQENIGDFRKQFYYTEIKKVIRNYIEGNLNLRQELNYFVDSLFKSLNFPSLSSKNKNAGKLKGKLPIRSKSKSSYT